MNNDNRAITTEDPCGIPLDRLIDGNFEYESCNTLLTGLLNVDLACGGLPEVGLAVIAGRPAMGHKRLALTMARNMAVALGVPTAYVSTELSEKQLAQQLMEQIVADCVEMGEHEGVRRALATKIWERHPPLYFESTNLYSLRRIEDTCRQLVEKRGVRVIFFDSPEDMEMGGQRRDFYDLGKRLKGLASQLGICLVAVTHLSRAVESRGGAKIPTMSDLRSGLEIHADRLILLHRPAYYGIMEDELGPTENMACLYIPKGVSYPMCVRMYYDPQYGTFSDRGLLARTLQANAAPEQVVRYYAGVLAEAQHDSRFLVMNDVLPPMPDLTAFEAMRKANPALEQLNDLFNDEPGF